MTPAARTLGKRLRLGYAGVLLAIGGGLGLAGSQMGALVGHDAHHANLVNEAGRQRFLGTLTVERALFAGQESTRHATSAFEATLAAWSHQQARVATFVGVLCETDDRLCDDFKTLEQRQSTTAALARSVHGPVAATREQQQALESALDAYLEAADRWVGDLSLRLDTETANEKRLIRGWMLIMFVAAGAVFLFVLEPIIRRLQHERSSFDTLARERQRLAEVVENIHDAVAITDLAGRIEWVNAGFVRLTGYAVEETLHRTVASLLHGPQTAAEALNDIERGLSSGAGFQREFLHYHRDGRPFWASVECRAVRDADGAVVGLFAIHTDITARKAAETALERQRALLAATSRVAGVGGWELDLVSSDVVWSEETCRIHGVPVGYQPKLDEAIKFYPLEARPVIEAAIERSRRDGDGWDLELPFIRATGEARWVRAVGEVEFRDGAPVRLRGAFQDITARKLIETQRRRDAEELQRLNTELDQFVYAASHDLRAPLRAVAALSAWIVEDDPSVKAETGERLQLIQTRVRRMSRMLDDILEYAKLGRQVRPLGALMSAATLAAEVVDTLEVAPRFRIDIAGSLLTVRVARMPLFRVLHNLIGNALKHHDREAGLIVIAAVETEGWYRFTISDDGPGVPELCRTTIFDMFTTLKSRDQQDGSGMGLAMVKKIVTQQGGRLGVDAVSRRGAVFWFEWPKAINNVDAMPCP